MSAAEKQDLARLLYEDGGREISQNFASLYSNLALASGLLAALLTVIASGELFGTQKKGGSVGRVVLPHLSSTALVLLSLAFPLLVRFFVRSVLAYANLLRFTKIRTAAWRFLDGDREWRYVAAVVDVYQTRWRSPAPFRSLVKSNLTYGYFWLFAVFFAAVGWGMYSATGEARLVSGIILGVGVGWELWAIKASWSRYFQQPSASDIQEIARANNAPPQAAPPTIAEVWLRWLAR